jgi:hypothetical protein
VNGDSFDDAAEADRRAIEQRAVCQAAAAASCRELELRSLGEQFDTVLDSGLFHVFDDDDRAGSSTRCEGSSGRRPPSHVVVQRSPPTEHRHTDRCTTRALTVGWCTHAFRSLHRAGDWAAKHPWRMVRVVVALAFGFVVMVGGSGPASAQISENCNPNGPSASASNPSKCRIVLRR